MSCAACRVSGRAEGVPFEVGVELGVAVEVEIVAPHPDTSAPRLRHCDPFVPKRGMAVRACVLPSTCGAIHA